MIHPGKVKVTIETPDGLVHEVIGAVVELSVNYEPIWFHDSSNPSFARRAPQEISLTVSGIAMWTGLAEDKAKRDDFLSAQSEWQCPYCQHINPREARVCGDADEKARGCGAHRPFIYE